MATIARGDLVALTAPQPLVSGITIPAGTKFTVLAVFTNSHGDPKVNLAIPGTNEVAASCVDVGRLKLAGGEVEAAAANEDDLMELFDAA